MRKLLTFYLNTVSLPCFLIVSAIGQTQTDTLQIETGLITGVSGEDSTVQVFKGIPYAAPPVDELRWQPPQPPKHWKGIYNANAFSPVCMQTPPGEGSFYQVEFYPKEEPISEDCLYLNVWTSAKSAGAKQPVMMWIHGGAFSQGSGSMPAFNGEAFAKNGVVLVTINYRLGIFGLFAHPELTNESEHQSSGNYGLLDQVAALKWIQKNIEAFGGDPNNVTVFGQSSGAGNINKLMASPLTKGLFHQAILQSGSAYTFGPTQSLEEVEKNGEKFLAKHDVKSLTDLRNWPASELLEKGSRSSFSPNIDGWFLKEDVYTVFEEGKQPDIPILAGSNADEGSTLFGAKLNAEIFKNIIHQSYGEDAEAFLELYPHQTDQEARNSFNKGWRDEMAWGAHTLARIHTKSSGAGAWLYYFSKVPPGRNSPRYGAFHSAEIAYVFNTFDAVDRPWAEADRQLADRMISYWVNFALQGNPNGNGLPAWPEYDVKTKKVLELGKRVEPKVILNEEILKFYNGKFEKQKDR